MKIVVSFSGGRTSAKAVLSIIAKFGADNVVIIFMDTGAEHPKTYEFIRKLNDYIDVEIVCLRGDFSRDLRKGVRYFKVDISECKADFVPFSQMLEKYGVPYIGGMFCTDRMKLKPFEWYCKDNFGVKQYSTWLGIRFDEPKRLVGEDLYNEIIRHAECSDDVSELFCRARNNPEKYPFDFEMPWSVISEFSQRVKDLNDKNLHYIAEIDKSEKSDILDFWREMEFDLDIPEWLGNCMFCPKKSDLKLVAASRDEPLFYKKWVAMLKHESVRVDGKTGRWESMYRGKVSLENIIATFSDISTDEIKDRIRGAKMLDSGSCSESCELYNNDHQEPKQKTYALIKAKELINGRRAV